MKPNILSHPEVPPLCRDLEPCFEWLNRYEILKWLFIQSFRDQALIILTENGLELARANIIQKRFNEENGVIVSGPFIGWTARPFIMAAPMQGWMLARPFKREKAPQFAKKMNLSHIGTPIMDHKAWTLAYDQIKYIIRNTRPAPLHMPQEVLDLAPSLP